MAVEVEDSGCGIDPKKLAEIFQHLFRLAANAAAPGWG